MRLLNGAQILGADGGLYVAVRLKDPAALVKSQGGATGALAYQIAPQTITKTVYDTLAGKLSDALLQQGVAADVTTQSTPGAAPGKSDLASGIAIGAIGLGARLGAVALFLARHVHEGEAVDGDSS